MGGVIQMPRLGLGTWKLEGEQATDVVAQAIDMGYRHIDTAPRYQNEAAVGKGIHQSSVAREEVFVTTKIWYDHLQPEDMRRSVATSLDKLQMDAVDLLLIHWPNPDANWDLPASLETLLAIKEQGWAHHIGVANFPVSLLQLSWGIIGDALQVNQVEYHLGLQQQAVLAFTQSHNMVLTAYCPLAHGSVLQEPVVQAIAAKHHVEPAQVALAWLFQQQHVAAIPKAASIQHLQANLAAQALQLDAQDLAAIAALPKNQRFIQPDFAPLWDAS